MIHVLVTGATDGIGLATARELNQRGMTVLTHGRSKPKATAAAKAVGPTAVPVWGDLGEFRQVRDLAQGAPTSVYRATAPELAKVSGRYYSDSKEVECAAQARDPKLEEGLWELSQRLTAGAP